MSRAGGSMCIFLVLMIVGMVLVGRAETEKLRILYILDTYPKISETYIQEELASVWDDYTIKIVTWRYGFKPPRSYYPYTPISASNKFNEIDAIIQEFKPDILHTHWMHNSKLIKELAEKNHIPFTMRSHSFDTLGNQREFELRCRAINSPLLIGLLCFPALKERFVAYGLDPQKVVPCWPIIHRQRFYRPEKPTLLTRKVLNVGIALPKKNHTAFMDLAAMMKGSDRTFNLYVIGEPKDLERYALYNEQRDMPVTIMVDTDPEDMPRIYQEHEWLVYTADPAYNTSGLPMAIAEAQASGIGICWQELPNRRQEQLEYLGGAGYLFTSIDELPQILLAEYPEHMRLLGLQNSQKCDIQGHKGLLTDLWNKKDRLL